MDGMTDSWEWRLWRDIRRWRGLVNVQTRLWGWTGRGYVCMCKEIFCLHNHIFLIHKVDRNRETKPISSQGTRSTRLWHNSWDMHIRDTGPVTRRIYCGAESRRVCLLLSGAGRPPTWRARGPVTLKRGVGEWTYRPSPAHSSGFPSRRTDYMQLHRTVYVRHIDSYQVRTHCNTLGARSVAKDHVWCSIHVTSHNVNIFYSGRLIDGV